VNHRRTGGIRGARADGFLQATRVVCGARRGLAIGAVRGRKRRIVTATSNVVLVIGPVALAVV